MASSECSLISCREGEQNVLGSDVRGTQGPGLIVGREQRPLGIGGQSGGDVRASTLLGFLLQLRPQGVGIRAGPFEYPPHHRVLEGGVE